MSDDLPHAYRGDHERLLHYEVESFNLRTLVGAVVCVKVEDTGRVLTRTTSIAFVMGIHALVRVEGSEEPVKLKDVEVIL